MTNLKTANASFLKTSISDLTQYCTEHFNFKMQGTLPRRGLNVRFNVVQEKFEFIFHNKLTWINSKCVYV